MNSSSPKTLGDFVTLQRGNTYKSKLKGEDGPILLGLATIQRNGGFRSDKLVRYSGDSSEKVIVQAGDLYASLKDVTQAADLLGSVARFPDGLGQGRLTQDTVRLVPVDSACPTDYLYWLLRAPQTRDLFKSMATGTTNLGLARTDFLGLEVPPLNSKRPLLVRLLQALDDKIELNRKMNQTLEEMAQALFKSRFIDFDGHDPDDLVDSELGPIPRGWEVGTLEAVAHLNPNSWTKKKHPPTVTYVDLSNTSRGRILDTTIYDWDDAPSRARRILETWDTIFGCVRPGNRSYALVYDKGLTGSTGFAVLRAKEQHGASFVYLAAIEDTNVARLTRVADGAAYPAVRPNVVHETPCVTPPATVLRDFDDTVRPMLARIGANERESTTLAELRDTLLTKLISGEIRVPDAEAAVEAVV